MPDGIHCLPIPTPFAVGRVNCYLVEDEPLTLVDTGPNSGTSLTRLERALAEHGHRVEDLRRIVLTHQHPDHIGLAQILVERSGAELCALDRLAPWLAGYAESMERDDAFAEAIMLRNGVPADVTSALRSVTRMARAWGGAATVTTPLSAGGELRFAGRTWTVHHRPGHSPSDTVFHGAERRQLMGGDHLIGHISSNPLVSRPLEGGEPQDRPRALMIYLDSLAATREMDVDLVWAGHGEPVRDHRTLIDERARLHERRAEKIAGLIAEQPRSAHEIATAMWGGIALTQAYLTLSEVLGHVDLLLDRGAVIEDVQDGVVRFAPA